jgi:FMN phosphatase YigB (HAD superfamily)
MEQKLLNTQKNINSSIVVAFDLHDVLFSFSAFGVLRTLWKLPYKSTLILHLFSPSFWKTYFATKKQALSTERRFGLLVTQFPFLKKYRSNFIELCNQQRVDQKTLAYIKQLKIAGYRLIVASNIGENTYKDLAKRFPDVIALFDYAFTSGKIAGYKKKPYHSYFVALRKYIHKNIVDGEHIVFIDNKRKNIRIAEKHGICGIHFTSAEKLPGAFDKIITKFAAS